MQQGQSLDLRTATSTVLAVVLALLVFGATLFWTAGTLRWPAAWLYFAVMGGGQALTTLVLLRWSPDLLRERLRPPHTLSGVQRWDLLLSRAMGLLGPIGITVVAGLDRRFGWSAAPADGVVLLALGLAALGQAFSCAAMIENRYFAAVVRTQPERGQTVVRTGPYRVVRHPGYAGALLFFVMAPLVLGSAWATIPVFAYALVTVFRTEKEDRFLVAELAGYRDYTRATRWKLVPFIW